MLLVCLHTLPAACTETNKWPQGHICPADIATQNGTWGQVEEAAVLASALAPLLPAKEAVAPAAIMWSRLSLCLHT